MKTIPMTTAMRTSIANLKRALETYRPGLDSASVVELPKLELADATLAAVRAQLVRLPRAMPARAGLRRPRARRRA